MKVITKRTVAWEITLMLLILSSRPASPGNSPPWRAAELGQDDTLANSLALVTAFLSGGSSQKVATGTVPSSSARSGAVIISKVYFGRDWSDLPYGAQQRSATRRFFAAFGHVLGGDQRKRSGYSLVPAMRTSSWPANVTLAPASGLPHRSAAGA